MNDGAMDMARVALRGGPLFACGLLAAAALAVTTHLGGASVPPQFQLVSPRGMQSARAGSTVRYQIAVRRDHYRGPVRLSVVSSDGGALSEAASGAGQAGKVTLTVRGHLGQVAVTSGVLARPGRYMVKVQAVGGRNRAYLTLGLIITTGQPASFTAGGTFGELWPGASRRVDVTLTNPNSHPISVSRLTVSVESVRAPRATAGDPCPTRDFAVSQFSGAYPLWVPAHTTVQLSALDPDSVQQPDVRMLAVPNENGCQGATVTLSYHGTASSA